MNMLILCFKETFCGTSPNQSFLPGTRLKMLFAAVSENGRRKVVVRWNVLLVILTGVSEEPTNLSAYKC